MSEERKFDLGWPYGHVTRNGYPAIARQGEDGSVVALVHLPDGICRTITTLANGRFRAEEKSGLDLFNGPASSLNDITGGPTADEAYLLRMAARRREELHNNLLIAQSNEMTSRTGLWDVLAMLVESMDDLVAEAVIALARQNKGD